MPDLEEINSLAGEPRNDRIVRVMFAKCAEVAMHFGQSYIRRLFFDSWLRDELLEDLPGIIGEAFQNSLARCGQMVEFTRCFFRKVKDKIIDKNRAIARHHRNRVRLDQLGRVGNDSEDDESLDEQNLFGASPDPDPLEWAVGHDMREAIAFAREGLSPREAEIFGLWIDHDRTNSEIAQQLRITESAVRTFKYRASVKIAKHINQRKRDGDATRAR